MAILKVLETRIQTTVEHDETFCTPGYMCLKVWWQPQPWPFASHSSNNYPEGSGSLSKNSTLNGSIGHELAYSHAPYQRENELDVQISLGIGKEFAFGLFFVRTQTRFSYLFDR